MPVRPDAPLRKVTLNLYEADCAILEDVLGHGWSTRIRDEVSKLAHNLRPNRSSINAHGDWTDRPRTLGDLAND